MRVGKPRVQRREAHLGAVSQQQKHEREIEQRRVEGPGALHQNTPRHRLQALAQDRARSEIDEDRPEERERNANAAENEILPRRLQRLVRPIDADHQDGGQRRQLDRDPHQAHVVREQRQVHREHERLIHGVIEAQVDTRQAAGLELVRDVARAEHAGGEAHEGIEDDEYDVDVVDDQEQARLRPHEEERHRADKREQGAQNVEPRGGAIVGQERQQHRAHCRDDQDRPDDQQAGIIAHSGMSGLTVAHRGTGRAREVPPSRSARGSGTGRCRSRSAR